MIATLSGQCIAELICLRLPNYPFTILVLRHPILYLESRRDLSEIISISNVCQVASGQAARPNTHSW